jgi:hypothetical protein
MKRPIIRLEDGTEVIETTGDVDALEHGGGVLYRESRGREFYWQFWREREAGQKNFEIFTTPVPDDVIAYFDPDIKELCKYADLELRDVRRLSRSKSPVERLQVVVAICDVYGPSRVDPSHDPEILDPFEMSVRWGDVFGVNSNEVFQADLEDFIVRETSFGDYECGCVDGTYLGRHKEYKHALCAIADFIRKFGMERSNLFHEHERGQLELVNWEPETFVGRVPKRRGKLAEAPWRNAMKRYASSDVQRKGIDRRAKAQKSVMKDRTRKAAQFARRDRLERAREFRRSLEESYT